MQFSSSPAFPLDFAKVAVMLMGISCFQAAEEELMKLTTNNEKLTTNNQAIGEWDYVTSGSLEH